MHSSNYSHARIQSFALILLFTSLGVITRGQEKSGQKTGPADEVIRVNTELVQTDVTVFDKNGQFVDGLGREQFELRVDGKPVPVGFFERVVAGRPEQAAERINDRTSAPNATSTVAQDIRGRSIIFFVDDLHLSLDSLGRTREALTYFMEHEMTPWDQVAFVSASGQIGFLQQFTDNKAVLRTALARLKPIPYTVRDTDQPPMTEYIAIRIMSGDREAADLYVDKIIEGLVSRQAAKAGAARNLNRNAVIEMVKNRANQIVFGVQSVTDNSLAALENLLRTTQQISGRKMVFFISDGFFLETKNGISAANTHLERVVDTATRTGSVIYTIDARGLFALLPDATGERPFDPKGRIDRATVGEAMISQEGLATLAGNTGGRFLKSQNYFDRWVARMLDETSNYYVLAWRPETEEQKVGKFKRIEVGVVGRPDLTVRLNRGYIAGGAKPDEKAGEKGKAAGAKEGDVPAPSISAVPKRTLPTLLSTSFVDVPGSGTVLTSSVQVATDTLNYGEDGKQTGSVDIAGLVLNDQGKQVADFKTRLNVTPLSSDTASHGGQGVIYNYRSPLAPGLYQIRVAAREVRGGQVGSAAQWIEIPDLAKHQLTLSSLLLGGTVVGGGAKEEKTVQSPQIQFSVDRRFARTSRLNFMLFIYNATQAMNASGAIGMTTQVQVLSSDGRTVVDTHEKPLVTSGVEDLARIPYAGSFPLQALTPGHYLLKINIKDQSTKASAMQQAAFTIE